MPLPRYRYVVLDQNILRKATVVEPALEEFERNGRQLLLSASAREFLPESGQIGES